MITEREAGTSENTLPDNFCAVAADDRPRAASGLTERGEVKPGVSATTVPGLPEPGTAVSGVSEKAIRSRTESGVPVTMPSGAEGPSSSSSTTRTGRSGAEEEEVLRFGGDGESSRTMGSRAASSGRFWRGGDGEKASRKSPGEVVEAAEPWERLREEGGEENAPAEKRPPSSSSSSGMSTTGIWEDAMGGSIRGLAGETDGEF